MTEDRIDRCVLAIHDYGTRDGATPRKVKRQLREAGFTEEEIIKAVNRMHPTP